MPKSHVYRVDDRVRIVTPKWIKRIGYPLVWSDLIDEVQADPQVKQAYLMAIGRGPNLAYVKVPYLFEIAVAKERVAARGFGGRERSIHYLDYGPNIQNDVGSVQSVLRKYVAYTGTYYPPTASGDPYFDDEPGGLTDRKANVILCLNGGEIEACNVEPV